MSSKSTSFQMSSSSICKQEVTGSIPVGSIISAKVEPARFGCPPFSSIFLVGKQTIWSARRDEPLEAIGFVEQLHMSSVSRSAASTDFA